MINISASLIATSSRLGSFGLTARRWISRKSCTEDGRDVQGGKAAAAAAILIMAFSERLVGTRSTASPSSVWEGLTGTRWNASLPLLSCLFDSRGTSRSARFFHFSLESCPFVTDVTPLVALYIVRTKIEKPKSRNAMKTHSLSSSFPALVALKIFRLFQAISGYFRLFQAISGYFRLFQAIST
jgi:hypothetical protein